LQYALEHVPHQRRSRLHAGTAHRCWIKAEVNKTVLLSISGPTNELHFFAAIQGAKKR